MVETMELFQTTDASNRMNLQQISGGPGEARTPDHLVVKRRTKFTKSCQNRRQTRGIGRLAEKRRNLLLFRFAPCLIQIAPFFLDLYHILSAASICHYMERRNTFRAERRSDIRPLAW